MFDRINEYEKAQTMKAVVSQIISNSATLKMGLKTTETYHLSITRPL